MNDAVYNLPICLMHALGTNDPVQNLVISNAIIIVPRCPLAVVAELEDNALVRLEDININNGYFHVQDVDSAINDENNIMGAVAEKVDGLSRIEQITIIDSKIHNDRECCYSGDQFLPIDEDEDEDEDEDNKVYLMHDLSESQYNQ
ncbi:MAG: hypothetical protein QS748_07700 [Candidatus Endonucleobacter bathymodioli]|uniref:Uncharacterized protein n=1 Tax=Candidatus Endonucleibacter bathymodioli TaxID=539814 RepID=A0AA90NLQ8_9GAMM|nr:hypothetical protein [Candidatus Endonucleobacter bathymodioli]